MIHIAKCCDKLASNYLYIDVNIYSNSLQNKNL